MAHVSLIENSQVANDRDIVIEAPADIVQRRNDDDDDDSLNPDKADEAPKRDLNIDQPELKELIEEKIAKEENAAEEEKKPKDGADVDTHEGEDEEEKVVEEKEKEKEEDKDEKEKEKEKDEKAKKEDLNAKIEAAAAQKNDDQPALAPPMVRSSVWLKDCSCSFKAPNGPGEMGKAVKIENPDSETKTKIDKGWKDNAFNQWVKR